MEDINFEQYLKARATVINAKLEESLKRESSDHYIISLLGRSKYVYDNEAITKSILEPAWHLLGLGGKRWRPVLMGLILEAFGKKFEDYIEFCLVPEVVHNATLVHDDVEDNSLMRRGAPAVHVKYGVDIGVNLGDFLYYFPMVSLIDSNKLSMEIKNKATAVYIREMLRVSTGQAIDIAWHKHLVDPFKITEQSYLQMAYDKTGVLARMAAKMGAIIGGADDQTVDALGYFGGSIGVAFQIQDDVLNITKGHLADTKGGVGEDITEGKITLMAIHTIRVANEQDRNRFIEILKMHTDNQTLRDEAIAIIEKYDSKNYAIKKACALVEEAWNEAAIHIPQTVAKEYLKGLADFMISRSQ